jgi:hypothetical protein
MKSKIVIFLSGIAIGSAASYFIMANQWRIHHDASALTIRGRAMVAITDLLSESQKNKNVTISEILEKYVCDEYRRQKSISEDTINWKSYGLSERAREEAMESSMRYVMQAKAYNPPLVKRCGTSP